MIRGGVLHRGPARPGGGVSLAELPSTPDDHRVIIFALLKPANVYGTALDIGAADGYTQIVPVEVQFAYYWFSKDPQHKLIWMQKAAAASLSWEAHFREDHAYNPVEKFARAVSNMPSKSCKKELFQQLAADLIMCLKDLTGGLHVIQSWKIDAVAQGKEGSSWLTTEG